MKFCWKDVVRKLEEMDCLPENVNSVELKFIHLLIKILLQLQQVKLGLLLKLLSLRILL